MQYGVKLSRSVPLALEPHPQGPSTVTFLDWAREQQGKGRRLAVDLFSGAGGLGLGVENAGWTVVAAIDHDKKALETHNSNFEGLTLDVDMSEPDSVSDLIKLLEPLTIDLVVGGPPCQPFSRAGKSKIRSLVRDGKWEELDQRRELWRSFVRVATALGPRAVLMENVPDMALGDDLAVIREIAEELELSGYLVDYRLLDAWRFGVPQHRKRFFLQARRDTAVLTWPPVSEEKVSVRDAIEDLPQLGVTVGARELPREQTEVSPFALQMSKSSDQSVIFDHMTRPVREDDREAFGMMTSKTLYSDLPERLRRYRSDTFDDKYKRLDWDDLSRTITAHIAKDGYWYIHPGEDRMISVREAARLQTFPDHFRFAGSRSDAFRQIGNAVPPELGRRVSSALRPDDGRGGCPRDSSIFYTRDALTAWGLEAENLPWWRRPDENMSSSIALFIAVLNLHMMPTAVASSLSKGLEPPDLLTAQGLAKLDWSGLSRPKVRKLREVLAVARSVEGKTVEDALMTLATPRQITLARHLRGEDVLLVNVRVSRNVTNLLRLPTEYRGLNSSIKVGLAQLVGVGPNASLRMAALAAMSEDEVRHLVLSLDLE